MANHWANGESNFTRPFYKAHPWPKLTGVNGNWNYIGLRCLRYLRTADSIRRFSTNGASCSFWKNQNPAPTRQSVFGLFALAVEWSGPNFARQPIPLSALGIPLDTDGIFEEGTDSGGTDDSGVDTSGEGDSGGDTIGEGDSGTDTSGEGDSGTDTSGETDSGTETSGETDAGTNQKIKSGGAFGPLLMWILLMGLTRKAPGQIQSTRRQLSIR